MKIQQIGTKSLVLNELKNSKIHFIKLISEVEKKDYISHHILLADCSGSMSRNLKVLKDKIKSTLDALLEIPNSYVSVISYSDHNETSRILNAVKCDKLSYNMSKVYETIEKELYIKSLTVISEPLEESIDICKSLINTCDKHHIALFTDGCLVPSKWSDSVEENKCFNVAKICNQEGYVLNAIGFGQYYDRTFLKKLIETAGNGSVIHIDDVKYYFDVIIKSINKVNSESIQTAKLSTEFGKLFNISNSILSSEISTFVNENNIIAVIDTDSVTVDGFTYTLQDFNDFNNSFDFSFIDDFYYSLARFYLIEEDIDNFEFILGYLGDTALLERTKNCYSFIEKGNAVNRITDAIEDKNNRFLKGRNPEVSQLNEDLCLLEILQKIIEDEESCLYWDNEIEYHRITQSTKGIQDSIRFVKNDKRYFEVVNISIGSEKLNIGVKVKFDGHSIDTISGLSKECVVFRDYNLVNGGNVNVPYITAKLSSRLLSEFIDLSIIDNVKFNVEFNNNLVTLFNINLKNIKSVNKRILKSMSMTEIKENLYKINELKCEQWALNKAIKELIGEKDKVDMLGLSFDEQEVMKLLRINENGIYEPLKVEKDDTTPFEVYPTCFMSWDISQFPDKKIKEDYLKQISNDIKKLKTDFNDEEIYQMLTKVLNEVRFIFRKSEFKVNCVRIASALMHKSPFIWEVQAEKDKKTTDKILQKNMVVGGKVSISKKTIDDAVIEEKKWIQLVKCN